MATIVIVHGAFGGGREWRAEAELPRARGHETITPTLTGFGGRGHVATPRTGSVFELTPPAFRIRFEEAAQAIGEGWRIPAPAFENDPTVAAFAKGAMSPRRCVGSPIASGSGQRLIGCRAPISGVPRIRRG